jgi:hypothetical protein
MWKERIDDICVGGLRNICIPGGYCLKCGLKVHIVLVPYLEIRSLYLLKGMEFLYIFILRCLAKLTIS